MKPLAFGLCIVLCCPLAAPSPQSTSSRAVYRVQTRERTLTARITAPPQRRAARQVNMAQLRHDAQELAQLEGTIQEQIRQAQKGVVPKDLSENLKRIRRLSKRLRDDLLL